MQPSLQQKLLQRAVEIVGGKAELCRRLEIERHALEFWLAGRARPPEYVFLAAADLVLEDDVGRASRDRRKQLRDTPPPEGATPGVKAQGPVRL